MLDSSALDLLPPLALRAIQVGLKHGRRWQPETSGLPPGLAGPGASFVTLRRRGRLLGCIGSLVPHRPLAIDVATNAAAAAFDDPRLPSMTDADLPGLDVHVCVLGRMEPLAVSTRQHLADTLRPGVDGVLVEDDRHRATLLPTAWDELDQPQEFLAALWAKAGLDPDDWPAGLSISRYQVQQAAMRASAEPERA